MTNLSLRTDVSNGSLSHDDQIKWLERIDGEFDLLYEPDPVLIVLYMLVLTLSLFANTLLIVVVVKFQYMRSVTNIFLVNLSLADLLVTLFCMPIQVGKAVTLVWFYGDIVCKLVNYLQGVAVAASVFTLAAMSVDRYLAITQSLRAPWQPSRRGAALLLAALWLVALVIFAPLLHVARVQREHVPVLRRSPNNGTFITEDAVDFCTETWPNTMKKELFGTFSFILVYAVPGTIMVVAYSLMGRRLCSVMPPFDLNEGSGNNQQRVRLVRERKRVAWVLLLLASLFAICWLPYNILMLLADVTAVSTDSLGLALPYALLLGHANSAVNPIVYSLMTRNFRRSLRKLICSDTDNIHSTTIFNMQSVRKKNATMQSSIRTRSTVTFRSSGQKRTSEKSHASGQPPRYNEALLAKKPGHDFI